MKASESNPNYPSKVREMTNYTIREIKKVCKDKKLPVNIFYPAVKTGAKLFGKFDLEEDGAQKSAQR